MSTKSNTIISFTNSFISNLKTREQEVIRARYGLDGSEPLTLQAIGDRYNITRERVRQIEASALNFLRKNANTPFIKSFMTVATAELKRVGGIQKEDEFLKAVYKNTNASGDFITFKNPAKFILDLTGTISYEGDNYGNWHEFWYLSQADKKRAQSFVSKMVSALNVKRKDQVNFETVFTSVQRGVSFSPQVARNYLGISKRFVTGPFAEFGLAHWAEVNPKTARDWAYVILKREKRPMHFSEIAKFISNHRTQKNTNLQTIHNELIKDERFVLVGRGMYGLSEFGLVPGTAREVIFHVLKQHGPLKRDAIITKVKEQRILKDGTILINLQNQKHFEYRPDGRYYLREA
jgi:hypothetical protein